MTEPFIDTWHDRTDAKKQEAARTMLAALKEARSELAQFEVTLPEVDAAIAQAESAGIKAEG